MKDHREMEQAMDALEAQRASLGDAELGAALVALRRELVALGDVE